MSFLGAYLLVKALKGPSVEERRRAFTKMLEGDQRKFFKHVDTCAKTNDGNQCRRCHKLGGLGQHGSLEFYTKGLLESPETTTQPFSRWLAEREANQGRIQAIKDAVTDQDFEVFGLRAFRELGIEIGTDYEFTKVFEFFGKYLLYKVGALTSVMPVTFEWSQEDWSSGEPWRSMETDDDSDIY